MAADASGWEELKHSAGQSRCVHYRQGRRRNSALACVTVVTLAEGGRSVLLASTDPAFDLGGCAMPPLRLYVPRQRATRPSSIPAPPSGPPHARDTRGRCAWAHLASSRPANELASTTLTLTAIAAIAHTGVTKPVMAARTPMPLKASASATFVAVRR